MVELDPEYNKQEKCHQQVKKKLFGYIVISLESCVNIKRFLAFFGKAESVKVFPPVSITYQSDISKMFEWLYHVSDEFERVVKWEFEVEEGWLPYQSFNSSIFHSVVEFLFSKWMASWMEVGEWCLCYQDFLGSQAYQLGEYGYTFHVGCM